jgi:hypothetical protein
VTNQAFEEGGRGDRRSGVVGVHLRKDRRGRHGAGITEIGVRNQAGDAGGKVGQGDDRQRRQVHVAGRQVEAGGQRAVLGA